MITITADQLKQELSEKFSIKCFVDLADLTNSPTQAYKILQQHHQSEFLVDDRLVFYTEHDISDKLLRHVYQAATLIDISNFFLLFCSPSDLEIKMFTLAQENHGDNVPFQCLQKNVKNTKPLLDNFVISNVICPMPWMHMMISTKGQAKPCCMYQKAVGDVAADSIHDIFHNQNYVELRQQLSAGIQADGCKTCWDLEKNQLPSHRTRHLSLLKSELITRYLDHPNIVSLDISPGNTCNFKCRICSPTYSSLFAQETLSTTEVIPVKSVIWPDSSPQVFEEILSLLPSLTNIDMYGGEPFLIKHLHNLVQQAVEQDQAKHIRLHYNSNGSVYPKNLLPYWKYFKHVDIHFSIDNVGERFELERGGQWAEVESNIRKLLDLKMPNLKISLMPTVNVMNVFYLDEVLRWADDLDLPVTLNYLIWPTEFNIQNLTADAKKILVEKYSDHPNSEIIKILSVIQAWPDSDGIDFVSRNKYFDNIRGQDFLDTHRDIAQAMGY